MAGNGGGSQPKFTAAQMIKAVEKTKGMVYIAAKALGCSPATVYNYAKRYKSVQVAIDNERGKFLDHTELALYDAIEDGQGWAIAFALKTLGKNRGYTEKQLIEQQSVNLDVDFNDLNVDQIKRLANGENLADVLKD
jgi:hypothetical protein